MFIRIGVALITVGLIAGIAGAIFWGWDGPDHNPTIEYRSVNAAGTPAAGDPNILVVEDNRDRPHFFPFFPLLVVGGVLLTVGLVTRGGHWGGPRGRFDDWHRDAHRHDGETSASNG